MSSKLNNLADLTQNQKAGKPINYAAITTSYIIFTRQSIIGT
jgi:hypothetical protein